MLFLPYSEIVDFLGHQEGFGEACGIGGGVERVPDTAPALGC